MTRKSSFIASILFVASLSAFAPSAAQDANEALKALDDALPGSLIHNPLDMQWEKDGNDLKIKVVDAAALPSGKAVSARLKKRQDKPWNSTVRTPISGGVKKGEEIQVFYWARTAKAAKGSETAKVTLFVGRDEEPYDNILSEDIKPSADWELKSLKGTAKANFPEGELKVEYQLGRAAQTVELGPVYVSTLGTTSE